MYSAPVDETGTYKFSFANEDSAKSEIGDSDGSVRGAYTYVDDTGATHNVKYIAGPEIGYKVLEDTVDLTGAKLSKEFPLAHEVKLVNGFTPEVHAARSAHLEAFEAIRSLLPMLNEGEDEVKVHHLRHEIPATVHRTIVPEYVHSEVPPPVRRPAIEKFVLPTEETPALIDGLTPETAAQQEAHLAYQEALKKLLPMLTEEGEIIVPVHHVHHVHHQGHIQAAPAKITKHDIKITTTPDVHIIEHLSSGVLPKVIERTAPVVRTVAVQTPVVEEKVDFPLAADIELIDGYTPEVWAARQAHLSHHAIVKSLLPALPEDLN